MVGNAVTGTDGVRSWGVGVGSTGVGTQVGRSVMGTEGVLSVGVGTVTGLTHGEGLGTGVGVGS
jgi:hypothetical protein